jgi:ArsR family transcriptional regulator, cadmium/lead-responsive transcriptional repressor
MAAGGREGDALWAAVGDPTRRRLLDALLLLGEATATTLSAELPVTRQAVAKHLTVLGRAGLVEGRRDGREVLYTVRPERLDEVSQAMARVVEGWDRRLATIKRLAESAHAESKADD